MSISFGLFTTDLDANNQDRAHRKAALYFAKHMYARAAVTDQKVVLTAPRHIEAQALLKELEGINPHYLYGLHETGFTSEIDYISDIRKVWQYSTAFYNYDSTWGLASFSLNNATRFGETSNQGMFSILPVIDNHLYFRLTAAYANQPLLFPHYVGGAEIYVSGALGELSIGGSDSFILPKISFVQYTGSISKEWQQYWASFRPYYYIPRHGPRSLLYTGTLIRYFGPKDIYARVTVGSGTTPDLANLTTVDFLQIRNNFVTVIVQFPVINHSFLFHFGGDYQRWIFPSSRVRNISGIILGFSYRFQKLPL